MTKVRISPALWEYQQAMAQLVSQLCEEKSVAAAGCDDIADFGPLPDHVPELWVPGLLRPPGIDLLLPHISLRDGHLYGIIQVGTSEHFGVMNVFVRLEDDQRNCIESGFAVDSDQVENHWGYFPSAPASPGTRITVHAIAMDKLGAVSLWTERVTI